MRLALFSDIHANCEALQVAFDDMDRRVIDKRICLGDIVGYGASVNDVVEMVANNSDIVVVGNHDKAVLNEIDISGFNSMAKVAVLWARDTITKKNRSFLKKLPYQISYQNLLFTHASPFKPKEFRYIANEIDVLEAFDSFKEQVCFCGHSHVHMTLEKSNDNYFSRDRKTTIDDIAIVNVGSVGQPRDNSPLLSYAVYDTRTTELEIIRLKYPVSAAAKKIHDVGLPDGLAKRLFIGR